ncbi:MAG TPA: ABC transporter ATP-binding protein [Bacteroidales bacterium]|nr:ABC transporter ATP-binding protein [Bacteroidales bacterium]
MSSSIIALKNVNASYSGNPALESVNFHVKNDDFIGVIGPNGGGKTTLLKIILDLIKPVSGEVVRQINKNEIGYLPQVNQFDHQFPISVRNVVLAGLYYGLTLKNKKSAKSEVDTVLDAVGISSLQNRPIGNLSGGELQRTMLARAIISSPKLLILDEPNTYVDNKFENELYRILTKLNEKMAILLVSHDVGTITPYIKTIACVNRNLHYHPSNEITNEQLKVYNCPIELVTHGPVPHRVMGEHKHD